MYGKKPWITVESTQQIESLLQIKDEVARQKEKEKQEYRGRKKRK